MFSVHGFGAAGTPTTIVGTDPPHSAVVPIPEGIGAHASAAVVPGGRQPVGTGHLVLPDTRTRTKVEAIGCCTVYPDQR